MKKRQKQIIFLILLISLLFIINYNLFDSLLTNFFEESDAGFVERVIDGDTVVINNGSVRLLGINSPERGEKYSEEAKKFLEEKVLNKTVELRYGKEKKDRYNRTLAYVFFNEKNVNLEIVEKGFANFYFPSGKDIYYENFLNAWKSCIASEKNLCEKSGNKCANCVILKDFNYKKEIVTFENICSFDCDLNGWKVKDEGRKNFVFPKFVLKGKKEFELITGQGKNSEIQLFWAGETYVWTPTGDTLFLRDNSGKLVFWRSY